MTQAIPAVLILGFRLSAMLFLVLFPVVKSSCLLLTKPWIIDPLWQGIQHILLPLANLEKKELVATKAVLQTFTHSFKIIVFISLGFDFISNLLIILAASACTIIGSKIGTTALGKLSDKRFNILFKVFLLGAAARLIWKTV